MENNKKIRDLYSIYLELGHEVFEEKIKKPMELCLQNSCSNLISMNSLNTIIANAMEEFKLGEAGFDEYDIFSPPTIEEKINYDYNIPPIYDDYGDENNNDSYFIEFAPTTTNKIDYAYVESNNFMHETHDKNALCDSYIVEFAHDAAESYYERGKHGYRHLNNIKFPLFMLRILKLLVIYPLMLVTLFFMNSFVYKTPLHRKCVRLKCS